MAKVNIRLVSFYNKISDRFEFYSGDVVADNRRVFSEVGFKDLKKFAVDTLYEIKSRKIENPKYNVRLTSWEGEYFGDFKTTYPKKPSEEERKELTKALNSKTVNRRVESLVRFCS